MPYKGKWLDIQEKVSDTVVQVFSTVTKFNWFEPYRPPQQMEFSGSGFFISESGHLITNFHVVHAASGIQIQIPSFGKEPFSVETIGVYPEMDLALLCLKEEDRNNIVVQKGAIPRLSFGDSDRVLRTQEILALGYPLGGQSLKSTQGIVSGREKVNMISYIQTTAPLNPGNSGGPSLNHDGEVIGINFAGVLEAQNIGFVIPINEVKSAIQDLHKVPFLRKPYLGGIFSFAHEDMAAYFKNPINGGFYVAEVFTGSLLEQAGVEEGDMLYEMNGHTIDSYGEISVDWSEDKISLFDLLNRSVVGDKISLVLYRRGKKMEISFSLKRGAVLPIRIMYPQYEPVDYEVIGGMVIMHLTLNHVEALVEHNPFFYKYMKIEHQSAYRLIITHLLPDSLAQQTRTLYVGNTIECVNGTRVYTLDDFRKASLVSKESGFLTVKMENKAFAAFALDKIMAVEDEYSAQYRYKKSALVEAACTEKR